ncbi:MAG: HEAT repeat domain-containing protein [Bacteroidetes bacterium]|nr:HEAT repeat domain-containing protein [Bacteroidota bacterium]
MKTIVMVSLAIAISAVSLFASEPAVKDVNRGEINWNQAEKNYIFSLLIDNAGVRQSAAGFLAQYNLKGGVEPLIRILENDKVEQVRMAAALALITIGDSKARKAVEDASFYDGSEKVSKFCESLLLASNEKTALK